jgi:hypothetical protein
MVSNPDRVFRTLADCVVKVNLAYAACMQRQKLHRVAARLGQVSYVKADAGSAPLDERERKVKHRVL